MKSKLKLGDELRKSLVQFQTTILLKKEEIASLEASRSNQIKILYLEIMEVLDAMEILFEHFEKSESEVPMVKVVHQFKTIYRKMIRLLSSREVQKIEFPDSLAKPEVCKVIESQPHPDHPEGHILKILKQGYHHKTKVIRSAEVVVVSSIE